MTENKNNITDQSNKIMEKGDKNDLWPQNLNKQDKKQLAYISAQYGLDPFFSDLTILGGNPYVTASGLKRNAHESDDPPVSIQLERVKSKGNRHFEYKAKLWKKSTPEGRPYTEYGEASPQDCNSMISKTDKDLKAMARTRATNRVIRLAYNISLTSAEEISGYDPESKKIKDVSPQPKQAPTSQKKKKSRKKPKKPRKMTEKELEIKELIGKDKNRKQMLLGALAVSNAKSVDDLAEDDYEMLVESLQEDGETANEEDVSFEDEDEFEVPF